MKEVFSIKQNKLSETLSVSTPRKHLWREGLCLWEDGAVSDGSSQAGTIRYFVLSAFRGSFV